ncbi:MAG: hypothetical protein R2911_19520 [Caldilineaceae bacterium]
MAKLRATPPQISAPPPLLGEHTDEVSRDFWDMIINTFYGYTNEKHYSLI